MQFICICVPEGERLSSVLTKYSHAVLTISHAVRSTRLQETARKVLVGTERILYTHSKRTETLRAVAVKLHAADRESEFGAHQRFVCRVNEIACCRQHANTGDGT